MDNKQYNSEELVQLATDLKKLVRADAKSDPGPIPLLQEFRDDICEGKLPSAHVLILVAERFGKYLDAGGDLTLDEAFDLKSKQKSGPPLVRDRKNTERLEILLWIYLRRLDARSNGKGLSIDNAASEAVNHFNLDAHFNPEGKIDNQTLAHEYSTKGMERRFDYITRKLIELINRSGK